MTIKKDHLPEPLGKGQLRKTQKGHKGKEKIKDPDFIPPPSKTLTRLLKLYADRLTILPFSRERSVLVDACLFIIESEGRR